MAEPLDSFQPCEICAANDWQAVYRGPVRDGAFGKLTEDTTVAQCGSCGIQRLHELSCHDPEFHESEAYRKSLEEGTDAASFFATHDRLQSERLTVITPHHLRDHVVADIGCGAGSFLDHISGVAQEIVAIDPCTEYHGSLSERGFRVYPYAADAKTDNAGRVDTGIAFDVIEHVGNPRVFLADIRELLTPEGRLYVSTPNRNDVLMEIALDNYRPFFYRVHHRWYFDANALEACAKAAGLKVVEIRYVQRFGLSNTLYWLRDAQPTGHKSMTLVDDPILDGVWQGYLESRGLSDRFYAVLSPSA